jgi:hypothetical protein
MNHGSWLVHRLLNRLPLEEPVEEEPMEEEEPIEKEPTDIEEVSLAGVFKDTTMGQSVTSADGTTLAKIEVASTDPNDFSIRWRLRIPSDIWESLDVICDGKAVELTTAPLSDNRYKISKTVRGYTPSVVDEEEILELRTFPRTKHFLLWVDSLTPEAVEAYRQIYFDRWCFDTASHKDRMYFELLDEELKSKG